MSTLEVFAFGDQTFDISSALGGLLRGSDSATLSTFFRQATAVLKEQIKLLTPEQQAQCPQFTTLRDLLPYYQRHKLNPAFAQALTCLTQLAIFIKAHDGADDEYPSVDTSCAVGVCTGALAAGTISCATSIASLQKLSLHTVAIAFRMGALAWDVANRLLPNSSDTAETDELSFPYWTLALSVDRQTLIAAIDAFASSRRTSRLCLPWISANVGTTQFSVSGQPEQHEAFLASFPGKRPAAVPLSILAPYHASHLYTNSDVEYILACLPSTDKEDIWPRSRIGTISTAGESYAHNGINRTFVQVMRQALTDCLQQPLALDKMDSRIASYVNAQGCNNVQVSAIALSFADRLAPQVNKLLETMQPASKSIPQGAKSAAKTSIPSPNITDSGPLDSSPIAVIACSGRFPQADNMAAFWDILQNGVDTHKMVAPIRWDSSQHVSSDVKLQKNVSGTGFGCWLDKAGQFDATFFNMSPREAPQVDPAQRLALLTATEALEQAGIVPNRTSSTRKNRVGVFYGCTSNDWMETNSAQNIDTYFIPGGNRAFIPGRVNYHFKFSGPSYTIDTACSSSLAALHMACNALRRGELDTAIVGGTNVLTNPDMTAGLDRGHFLSRTGNCKTFDDGADGYCRGEAVVTLILKRLPDAQADKDPIQCCILEVATNHNAEAESITRPHVGAQQELFHKLLSRTGMSATDIDYVEMHGTGTQAGDAGETTSVVDTLSPWNTTGNCARKDSSPLYIGAAKSNIGHGEAAAGVTSFAKVLLMLKNSQIPPHIGIKTKINHRLPNIDARNTRIARTLTPWVRPEGAKRRVLLNNFSAAGGNTALILEDAPLPADKGTSYDPRTHHVVNITAKSSSAMLANMKSLVSWLRSTDTDAIDLAKLSYTTTARRIHYRHRLSITGSSPSQIEAALAANIAKHEQGHKSVPHPPKGPRFVFAFTGQGSGFAGMGSDLYQAYVSFRQDIRRYDQLCTQMGYPSIRSMFEVESRLSGEFESASPTKLQLTHTCFQMALYRLWASLGVRPAAVVGHSLGEYAALYAAGSLSQVEVIHLVGSRAQLIESTLTLGTHAMLVVRASEDDIVAALQGSAHEISCRNAGKNVVLGGTQAEMQEARTILERNRIRCQYLDTPVAFHTSQMDDILDEFHGIATAVRIREPQIPVISPAYAKVLTTANDFRPDYFVQHCRSSVNISTALGVAKESKVLTTDSIALEIGPAPAVVSFIKDAMGPTMSTLSAMSKDQDTWSLMSQAIARMYMAGADIDWMQFHADFPGCQEVLELPAYNWDLKDYWLPYVHSWSLRKGDPPLVVSAPKLNSSSVQNVISNTLSPTTGGELVIHSDLSRKDLHPMVQGHHVYGVPLCTPSVYADIAMTVGEYIKSITGSTSSFVKVEEMNIQSALVAAQPEKPQLLCTNVTFDAKQKTAFCTFSSLKEDGSKVTEQHANCKIALGDLAETHKSLAAPSKNAKTRMNALQSEVGSKPNTYRFSKAMIYKMVGQLADFDEKYRGLCAITLDNDAMEAAGYVDFANIPVEGEFNTSPAYIDALSQLGGFVMNANEGVDLDKEVFINHGWKSLQLFEKIERGTTYYSHVKMQEGADKLWEGDITIFDNKEKLVGVIKGVQLQGVPKRLMHYIVTAANKKARPQPAGPAAAAPVKQPIKQARPAPEPVPAKPSLLRTVSVGPKAPVKTGLFSKALKIVSEEVGVGVEDLNDDVEFSECGLDSLLSLVISSRLRDELEIDFESSVFFGIGSIKALRLFLEELAPESAQEIAEVKEKIVDAVEVVLDTITAPLQDTESWVKALAILSEESGIVVPDLVDELAFADVGVDSLMSLVVCSRFRDELDIDLSNRAFFEECKTVADLRQSISGSNSSSSSLASSSTPSRSESIAPLSGRSTPFSDRSTPGSSISRSTSPMSAHSSDVTPPTELSEHPSPFQEKYVKKAASKLGPAWALPLQGSAKTAEKTLFLFPDGCGAATSYLSLPRVAKSVAVYAFNSPFTKTPDEMAKYSLAEVINAYVEGVRTRQPQGPYHLGGWSAGGILAYTVAQTLQSAGEVVKTLLLIDSPAPTKGLDHLPERFFEHCTKVGLFGTEMKRSPNGEKEAPAPPEWLMPHFRATINLLHDYYALPMDPAAAAEMNARIIWAGECAFDGVRYAKMPPPAPGKEHEDTEGMKFLTEKREDLGPGDWTSLLPGAKVHADVVDGHHHFSMMRDEGADDLVRYMRELLA